MFSKWLQEKHTTCHVEYIKTNKNKHGKFLLFKRSLPAQDDVLTAGGGDKDVSLLTGLIHGGDLITCTATGHKDIFICHWEAHYDFEISKAGHIFNKGCH